MELPPDGHGGAAGISDTTARHIIQEELAGLTMLSDNKVDLLLDGCMVSDIYSREKATYRSARKLFNSIEQIRDQAAATHVGGVN